MTEVQEREQCSGPGRPSVGELLKMLMTLPKHHGISAIAINGQTGLVFIETRHEDALTTKTFEVSSGPVFCR